MPYDLLTELDRWTDQLRAIRQYRNQVRMSITGLEPGSIKTTIAAMRQKRAKRRTEALAKLQAADAKHDEVDAEIERVAAALDKEADDAMHEFAEYTNGGPGLDDEKTEGTPLPPAPTLTEGGPYPKLA